MNLAVQHHPERFVVPFAGELTWPAAAELVDAVDAHLEHYHYRRVELVVASPGGLVAALEHILRALARWRARGVEVRTRVVASAESAAAVLVSLGDERTAAPGAKLLYHLARVPEAGTVTARASAALHGELSRADARIVGHLVERALATRRPVPHRAEPRDREALERIVGALAGHAPPGGRRPRLKRLAARAGRALDAAVRSGDRDTVIRVYRALARVDRHISAELARTLRLIDRVDDGCDVSDSPEPDLQAIALTVPEWRSLFPPSGAVPRAVLTRHVFAVGETGSGKTASVIMPVLSAMARSERISGALVIDPKRDLGSVLEREAPGRLERLDAGTVALDLMAGTRAAVDADLAARRWTSAAVRMLHRVSSFLPASPLRVLGPHRISGPNAEFFAQEGTALLRDVLGLVLMLSADDAPPPHEWIVPLDEASLRWVHALGERARAGEGARGPNALSLCAWALEGPLAVPLDEDDRTSRWLFADIARQAMAVWGAAAGEGRDLLERAGAYWRAQARVPRQYARGAELRPHRVRGARIAPPRHHALPRLRAGVARSARLRRRLRPARITAGRRTPPAVPAPARRPRCAARHGAQGLVLRSGARRARPHRAQARPPARGVCRRRIPPVRHLRRRPWRAELPRHLPLPRRVLRIGYPVDAQHRPRLEPRRRGAGHERSSARHPAREHRHQAGVPLHRRRHRGAGRRACPGPPGLRPRSCRAPARIPCPRRVLHLPRRRALRAPPARAREAQAWARVGARTHRARLSASAPGCAQSPPSSTRGARRGGGRAR